MKMIDINEIKAIVAERKRISEETQDNWDDGIQMCWDRFVAIFTKDIDEGIRVLENECEPDETYWISEIFEDIAAKTQSKEFIAAIHRIQDKMPEEVKKSIEIDIESAKQAMI